MTAPAIRRAAEALLDERRQLTAAELEELAQVDDASVPSLAALAHEVRLAWAGPTVEVEGILSAKTGGLRRGLPFLQPVGRLRHAGEGHALS